jgi:large subunit ribosomal protein L10
VRAFVVPEDQEPTEMNKEQKAAVVDEIAAQIESAEAVFAIDYRGISVPHAAELRARLRAADASFRVVKNSLTERAADKAGADTLRRLLEGPTALTFVRGDAAVAAKAISDLGRISDALEFKGGLMGGAELTIDEIKTIARLPARTVLDSQLVGLVASPLTGLVRGLNGLIAGLAVQLRQVADQGLLPEGEAPEEAEAPAAEAEEPAAEAEDPAAEEAAEADPGQAPAEKSEEPADVAEPEGQAEEAEADASADEKDDAAEA